MELPITVPVAVTTATITAIIIVDHDPDRIHVVEEVGSQDQNHVHDLDLDHSPLLHHYVLPLLLETNVTITTIEIEMVIITAVVVNDQDQGHYLPVPNEEETVVELQTVAAVMEVVVLLDVVVITVTGHLDQGLDLDQDRQGHDLEVTMVVVVEGIVISIIIIIIPHPPPIIVVSEEKGEDVLPIVGVEDDILVDPDPDLDPEIEGVVGVVGEIEVLVKVDRGVEIGVREERYVVGIHNLTNFEICLH